MKTTPLKRLALLVVATLIFSLISINAHSANHIGRLAVGMSNQLVTNLPAVSFKLQKSASTIVGGLVGINTDDEDGGYGGGLKIYRIFFSEPQLNFYGAVMGAAIKDRASSESRTAFQFDVTLGTEFHFAGLHSLGISFEFGVSFNKVSDFIIQTVGHNFFVAGIHFYI